MLNFFLCYPKHLFLTTGGLHNWKRDLLYKSIASSTCEFRCILLDLETLLASLERKIKLMSLRYLCLQLWIHCQTFICKPPNTRNVSTHHTPVPTVVVIQICLLHSQCRLYSSQNIRVFYVIYFCSGNSRGILYFELWGMMS